MLGGSEIVGPKSAVAKALKDKLKSADVIPRLCRTFRCRSVTLTPKRRARNDPDRRPYTRTFAFRLSRSEQAISAIAPPPSSF